MRLPLSGALPCNDMAQSAEQVLASIEAAGGHIEDSRTLAPTQPLSLEEQAERILRSTSDEQDQEDLQAEEAAHKAPRPGSFRCKVCFSRCRARR